MTSTVPGAHWTRAALQVNPYAYKGKNAPSKSFADEATYNSALLDECEKLSIRMLAITDHWSSETETLLIEAAQKRDVVALPGFEANSSEGVHLLVIFEAGTGSAEINAAIGICGATPGSGSGPGTCSYKDILEKMTERGALVVPAHANAGPSGLLFRMTGQPLEQMILHPDLHAIAFSPDLPDATNQAKIVANQKPFMRKHRLAVLHADDVMSPADLSKEGATSWFKVSAESLESLKHALRTPETRVRLQDPAAKPRVLLREISWTGGFLDQLTIPLSEDLTALIGGRGTGKSTAIESLRFVLGINPIGKQVSDDHKMIIREVLRSGTIVKVVIETVLPAPQRYTIERVVNELPVVKDASGTPTNQRPEDILPRVEIYGQHELAELATDSGRVAVMLQRFTGSEGPDEVHQKTLADLRDNREQLRKVEDAKEKLEDELSAIARLEEQVQQYDSTDVPAKLADQQRLAQDEAIFVEVASRFGGARNVVNALTDPQLAGDLTAAYDEVEDSPQKMLLERATAATSDLARKLADLATQAQKALADAEAAVAKARDDWGVAVANKREEYQEVLRVLHEQGLEPDKFVATKQNLQALKAKEPRRGQLNKTIAGLKTARAKLLGALQDHEQHQTQRLHDAVRAANDATAGVVVVQPVPARQRDHIKNVVIAHTTGQRHNIMAAIDAEAFSARAFVAAARKGVDELAPFGLKGAQAQSIITAGEPLFRELEELTVGLDVDVKLDVGYGNKIREYKSMSQLSKGQKATALLLLLLSGSKAPLIIDQPEDDLDNRFVYDGIVTNLRNLKGKRQVIVSTHNANVPVLGDAELIVTLEGDGQHGWFAEDGIGSLDDKTIRSYAENILEGGPDAFNARQHLYGF
jgi:DNA repair ATPase RecN